MCRILQNQFKHFHKSDRSDISANVVDICLCANIERCHFKWRTWLVDFSKCISSISDFIEDQGKSEEEELVNCDNLYKDKELNSWRHSLVNFYLAYMCYLLSLQ